jgi:DNA (cytosine-5)-methyltransferase 1
MAEIAKVKGTNGFRGISTFSGCGGSCLGFEMAGFEILWASEFIPEARETYVANHPGVILDPRDIRDVKPEEILLACGVQEGELDFMEGSPPCSGFSAAGIG